MIAPFTITVWGETRTGQVFVADMEAREINYNLRGEYFSKMPKYKATDKPENSFLKGFDI